jgi:hypothetical protein
MGASCSALRRFFNDIASTCCLLSKGQARQKEVSAVPIGYFYIDIAEVRIEQASSISSSPSPNFTNLQHDGSLPIF